MCDNRSINLCTTCMCTWKGLSRPVFSASGPNICRWLAKYFATYFQLLGQILAANEANKVEQMYGMSYIGMKPVQCNNADR